MSHTRTVAPLVTPVSLALLMDHLRLDGEEEDTIVTQYLEAATRWAEDWLGRALITQTWRLKLDQFPGDGVICLPRPPLQSVTSITYADLADVTQTLSTNYYSVDTDSEPGRVILDPDLTWPATYWKPQAVAITYVAGYGAAPANVPAEFKQGILYLAAHAYRMRESVINGTIVTEVPLTAKSYLSDRVLYPEHT